MPAHQISQAMDLTQLQGCKECCKNTSLICISCTSTLLCPLCFVFAETQLISQQLPRERPCCLFFFSRDSFQMCFSHWDDQMSASIRIPVSLLSDQTNSLDTEKIKFVFFPSVCLTHTDTYTHIASHLLFLIPLGLVVTLAAYSMMEGSFHSCMIRFVQWHPTS